MKIRPFLIVAVSLAAAWLLARTLRDAVFDITRVSSESMLPYLEPGAVLVTSRSAPCVHLPFVRKGIFCTPCEPGEAYVFRHPRQHAQKLVKFAVSPAEFLDGKARTKSGDIIWFTERIQTRQSTATPTMPVTEMPQCFFIGSNSARSVDSRDFGPVAAELVEGRVVYPRLGQIKKAND